MVIIAASISSSRPISIDTVTVSCGSDSGCAGDIDGVGGSDNVGCTVIMMMFAEVIIVVFLVVYMNILLLLLLRSIFLIFTQLLFFCRNKLRNHIVTSSTFLYHFTIDQLINSRISALSLYEDKLLVGCYSCSQLFIFPEGSSHFTQLNISGELVDAKWTPYGNIIVSTTTHWSEDKLVVISKSGEMISESVVMISESGEQKNNHNHLSSPQFISVSSDGVIYVACWETTGVYQSTDDGISWSLVFKSNSAEGHYIQAIKVIDYKGNDFWTMLTPDNAMDSHSLRIYSIARKQFANDTKKWKAVPFPAEFSGDFCSTPCDARLLYDGDVSIFLYDQVHKVIRVFSVNGSYHNQLLSSDQLGSNGEVYGLMIDKTSRRLFVGQRHGVIKVFSLNYDEG